MTNETTSGAAPSPGLREALDEAWKLLDIAYSAHQKLGFEGQGARGLPHETRMFAAEFSKPEEPKTPEHTILSGTGRYQKWREQAKAALAAPTPSPAPVSEGVADLPSPGCTYADHSYPAYSKAQMIEYGKACAALSRVSVEAWQPIESAPKDVKLLLFSPGNRISDDPDEPFQLCVSTTLDWCWATHWRNLPPHPASGEGR